MRVLRELTLILLLAGCSQGDVTGPGEVRWDKEVCARCTMSIGDRMFAAQVRGGETGEQTKLYKFDDIGCAVIWLDKQPWKEDGRTEVWVADHRNGQWIDARKASYVTGKNTPMGYGLGAQTESGSGLTDFAGAIRHIYMVEQSQHQHGHGHAHH